MVHNVLLVDDHPVFRDGLRYLLEDEEDIRVVGEAGDGESALELIAELSPDIVVMDVTMPALNGIEATKRITADFPGTLVVALSIHAEMQFVQNMLQAGAAGYILKESVPEELLKGIRCVMVGDGYLSPAITGIVVSQFRKFFQADQPKRKTTNEILETKFQLPQIPPNYVHRQRLVDLLEVNRELPIQVITSPAGYGKSALVSSWLREHEWPAVWLSLDEKDSDLRQFVTCFAHAVRKMFPGALVKIMSFLEAATLPPSQVFAATLFNELNLIDQHFILAFDDFHCVGEKSVHDLITEMLRYPSSSMHLVFVSRMDPFLPIAALRAQGQLAEIRIKNLQFTDEETERLLQHVVGREVAESVSHVLKKKMEGWITGLQLAAVSMQHQDDYKLSESGTSFQYVKEYLFDEVFQRQPEDIRKHMVFLSILKRFCAPLIEAVFRNPKDECAIDSWAVIRLLKNNNLFQIPVDSEGYWFRFHPMFEDLLLGQLQRQCSSAEIAELHLRAGGWLAENDHLEEAVSHLLAGGASEEAEEISARIGQATPLRLSEGVKPTHLPELLTGREQEILEELVKGKTNKEIGGYLYISAETVKSHLKNIYHKFGVKSRLQAVTKARELGFTVETPKP